MTTGYVYVLENSQTRIYKIGKAAEHRLDKRLKELDVPKRNKLIGAYRVLNYHSAERELHEKYQSCRIPQSEYFVLTEEQLAELLGLLKNSETDAVVIDDKNYCYGYVRLETYEEHLTLTDREEEVVAIDYKILPAVIKNLRQVEELYCFDWAE